MFRHQRQNVTTGYVTAWWCCLAIHIGSCHPYILVRCHRQNQVVIHWTLGWCESLLLATFRVAIIDHQC